VVVSDSSGDFDSYLAALRREAELWKPSVARLKFSSLYVGGGTPSLLSERELEVFFGIIRGSARFTSEAQVALEANPAFVDDAKAIRLKSLGVNWLSLGVQSLNPSVVRRVDRHQDNASVFRAYAAARKAGIKGINVDLLCGLEGQSEASFLEDVRAMARIRPDQIHLNFFEDTRLTLFRQRGGRLSGERKAGARSMHRKGAELLLAAGYLNVDDESFSLSVEAQNQQASIQSVNEGIALLGWGPGAVSHLPFVERHLNHFNLDTYRRLLAAGKIPVLRAAKLDHGAEMINYILNSLLFGRTEEGALFEKEFRKFFGVPFPAGVRASLERLRARGWLRRDAGPSYRPNLEHDESGFRIKQEFMSTPALRKLAELWAERSKASFP
jgi:oxygen-independent coproporphyrinogen-3 oxidase